MGRGIICLGQGGLGNAFKESGVLTLGKDEADVNDICQLDAILRRERPQYILNCTGVVGTAKCERDPGNAYIVNVGGCANIAQIAKKYGSFLIHFSTFYVGEYNVYSKSKMMAETVVSNTMQDFCIIRLPWLFGYNVKNFILDAVMGKRVSIFTGEYGYLAYDRDIVDYVTNNIDRTGTVTIGNAGQIDREEVLKFIGAEYDTIGRNVLMPETVSNPTVEMRPWKEALKEFMDGIRSM